MALYTFSISYETNDSTWKVFLLGESREQAIDYITKHVGEDNGLRFTSIDQRESIHAITPEILDKIRGPKPEELEPEKVRTLVCPWCESEDFKTNHALKMHIVKQHADSKKKEKEK